MSPFNVPLRATPNDRFDGTWEKSGRSLNAAAGAGLLGVGLVYTYGQTILLWIGMLGAGITTGGTESHHSVIDLMNDFSDRTRIPLRVSIVISQYCFMLLPTLWLIRRWHTSQLSRYIRLSPLPLHAVGMAALSVVFFFPTNAFLSRFFVSKLNIPHELIAVSEKAFKASGGGEFLLLVFIIAVTPALCEEVLFRGYVQRTFERTMGWKSIILVGVIFGLYHLQPLGLLSLSGLGILFGFFYFASRSIVPGMAAHFTNNFIVVLLLYTRPTVGQVDLETWMTRPDTAMMTLPVAVALAAAFWKATTRVRTSEKK
jgi:membrane protease YdiL (CAAX protease family)